MSFEMINTTVNHCNISNFDVLLFSRMCVRLTQVVYINVPL